MFVQQVEFAGMKVIIVVLYFILWLKDEFRICFRYWRMLELVWYNLYLLTWLI